MLQQYQPTSVRVTTARPQDLILQAGNVRIAPNPNMVTGVRAPAPGFDWRHPLAQVYDPSNVNSSSIKQLTQSIASGTAALGKGAVQFIPQTAENYANTFANLGNRLAGRPNATIQQNMGTDRFTKGVLKFSGATGQNKQLVGDVAQVGLAAIAPGVDKAIGGAAARFVPGVGKVVPRIVSNAAVGAGFNAASAAGNGATAKQTLEAAGIGGLVGGGLTGISAGVSKGIQKFQGSGAGVVDLLKKESNPEVVKATLRAIVGDHPNLDKVAQSIAKSQDVRFIEKALGDLPVEAGLATLTSAGISDAVAREKYRNSPLTGEVGSPPKPLPEPPPDIRQFNPASAESKLAPEARNVPTSEPTIAPKASAVEPTVTVPDPKTGTPTPVTQTDLVAQLTELFKVPEAQRTPVQTKQIQQAEQGIQKLQKMEQTTKKTVDNVTPTAEVAPTPTQEIQQATQGTDASTGAASAPGNPSVAADISQAELTKLPTALPKETSALQRTFLSVRGELSKMGQAGQEIANKLQAARDTSETGQAWFIKQIPSVLNLKGKNFEDFVNTLDALSRGESPSMSPEIAQAVNEWSQAIPQLRNVAVSVGQDVGDLGPYYFPRNYTELLKDQAGLNRTANQLVQSGQAANIGEALQQLRFMKRQYSTKFGHFENSRQFDLPGYDKSRNALISYIDGAFNKIGQTEQFGPKGEGASQLIGQLASEGHDAERATRLMKIASGTEEYNQPGVAKASNAVRAFNRVTKLGLSAILNLGQLTNTAAKGGFLRTARNSVRYLSKADKDFVDATGVNADSVLSNLREQTGISGKVTGKLTAPGFNTVERLNRGTSAVVGRDIATMLHDRAIAGDVKAEQALRELGVQGDLGQVLTPQQEIQAARKFVEQTQFKVDPQDLPAWTNSPLGKMAAQFRTFSYKQQKFMWDEVIKQAAKGNVLPLARFIVIGSAVGFGTSTVRGFLRGQSPTQVKGNQDNPTTSAIGRFIDSLNNVGAFGMGSSVLFPVQNAKSARFPQYVASSTLGPSAGLAVQTTTNIGQAAAKKPSALERQALGSVPVAGPFLSNKLMPYKPPKSSTPSTATDNSAQIKAAFQNAKVTYKGKQVNFVDLTDAQKKEAAQTDSKARQYYTDYKAAKTAFSAPPLLSPGISPQSAKILNETARLTSSGRAKWEEQPGNLYAEKVAQFENDSLGGKLTPTKLADHNKALIKYKIAADSGLKGSQMKDYFAAPQGKYALAQQTHDWRVAHDSTYSKPEQYTAAKALPKLKLYADYNKDTVDIYSMSKANIKDFIEKNGVTQEQWQQLVDLDKKYVAQGFGKYSKLFDYYGSGSSSRSSGRRLGSSGGSGSKATPNMHLSAELSPLNLDKQSIPSLKFGKRRNPKLKITLPQKPKVKRVILKT